MNQESERFNALSPKKRELYERLQAQRTAITKDSKQLKKRQSTDLWPLSFMQEQICFLESINPGNSAYNIPLATQLTGSLNVDALNYAIQNVMQRHEVFKTSFSYENGQWRAEIKESTKIVCELEDCTSLTREEVIHIQVVNQIKRPFNLERAPLIRINLYQLANQSHVLLIVMHHLITDGWSFGIFLKEMMEGYNAYVEGRTPLLTEINFSLSDFAHWQREQKERNNWHPQLEYWKKQLKECEPLALSTDFPRPVQQSNNGARLNFEIPQSITSKLTSIGQMEGVTPSVFFLTAFQIFLSRYSNQKIVVVGTPVANRGIKGSEGIIGPLINMLALKADLTENLTLREALIHTRNTLLEGMTNQDCPFELVVQAVNPVRDPSHPPLIQTLFNYQISPTAEFKLKDLLVSPLNLDNKTSKVDLELDIIQETDRIQASFEYCTAIFSPFTVNQMVQNFLCLLESMTKNLQTAVANLVITTDVECQKILHKFNETVQEYAGEFCIVRRFEAQAKVQPESKATIFNDEFYTYYELEQRASLFASYLKERGVQTGSFVGYFGERCKDLMVAIIGIFKAGGVYVPIDPTLPLTRIEFIIHDCKILMMVTQKKFLNALEGLCENSVTIDDMEWTTSISPLLPTCLDNEDQAYVIYTSGTTGQPKGISIHHRALRNRLSWMQAEYSLLPQDKVMQKTPLSFDVSLWELLWPLMTGATLVIAKPNGHMDPAYLYSLIERHQISTVHFVPSMLQLFIELAEKQPLLSLRQVFVSGEAITYELKERFFKRFPAVKLHNLYGPTEATIDVTYWDCSQRDFDERRIIPIGHPIANTQLYILDSQLQLVPIGVPGELFIGGLGVAKGYLNRPDLSAERFIPHPFLPNKMLYKTGDLARFLPTGAIEYLGRLDFQVKIKGFRIELGEIEAILLTFPGIRACITLAESDNFDAKYLISYVTLETGVTVNSKQLAEYVSHRLPAYMVPSKFIVLEKIPLSVNGKIDRKALPRAEVNLLRDRDEVDFRPPSTLLEQQLTDIWKEALGLSKVGVLDNIFSIGGDSIRTLRIVGMAQAQGLAITVTQILQHQNIAALAKSLEVGLSSEISNTIKSLPFELIDKETVALLPLGIEDAYPLAQLQAGMIFHLILDTAAGLYQNVDSIQIEGPLNIGVFQKTLDYLVAKHAILRTSFDFTSFLEPLQLVHKTGSIKIEVQDWTHVESAEQEKLMDALIEAEKQRHFLLTHPPLMRFLVHIRSKNSFQLTIPHHHAILDGWSITALCVEMFHVYQQMLTQGNPATPSTPKSSFRDFIAAERQSLESEQTRRFWLKALTDVPVTTIAADLNHADVTFSDATFSSDEINFLLADSLVKELIDLAAGLQKSLKSILLMAHCITLAKVTGEKQILTGLGSSGRIEEQGGDEVLGLFLNTVPLSVNLKDESWIQLLEIIHQAEMHLYPHRRFPLAEIQRLNRGKPPIATLFNFTNFHILEVLDTSKSLKILNQRSFTRTNFPFVASFDLTSGQKQRLNLNMTFDAKRYSLAKIEFIGHTYIEILQTIVKDPKQWVYFSSKPIYPMLAALELEQLIVEFNKPQLPYPKGVYVHELFEQQVKKSPQAIAVIFENQELTYEELNQAANRLAHHLQELGICPETLVGIYLERSLDMLIALFAVLKAGGAYVPIDPYYPTDRIRYLLQDSKVKILLTQTELLSSLPSSKAILVCVNDYQTKGKLLASFNPVSRVSDENLAYIIYTSGSTGNPKGVMIQHNSFACVVTEWAKIHQLQPADRFFQFSSISFDAAVGEIFATLIAGACLIMRSNQDSLVPSSLQQRFSELGITKCFMPTAYWHQFIAEMVALALPMPPLLKMLIIGGEAVQPHKVKIWQQHWGHTTLLINLYGPTETAVIATEFKFFSDSILTEGPMPIGQPLNHVPIYILDAQGHPTPIGVPGEIHIGGVQVARGYLNQPQLTVEKFISDPFSKIEKGRLYKTGDLATWQADGNIQYLGRLDFQVKIRGFRVELGEIESRLATHPQIAEAVVMAQVDHAGNSQLLAYLICKVKNQLTAKQVRRYLATSLPDYMIPSAILFLESLPLNVNGKLDRKALPLPADIEDEPEKAYVPPQTSTEHILVEIASKVLGVNRVSMTDSFFSLQGNSLLAIQFLLQIRHRLKVELPLNILFSSATFLEIALKVDALPIIKLHDSQTNSSTDIKKLDKASPILASYAQERLWFLNNFETQGLDKTATTYLIPLVWRLKGPLNKACLEQAFQSLVNRHDSFRTAFRHENSQLLQIISASLDFNLELLECIDLEAEELNQYVENQIFKSVNNGFNLSKPPLIRAILFQLSEEEHVLHILLHHMISDGWSINILLHELSSLYISNLKGLDPLLAILPLQYADYSNWQRSAEQQIIFSEQLTYWKNHLNGAPTLLNLPMDRARPSIQTFAGAFHSLSLNQGLTKNLKEFSQSQNVTLFMTLAAAFSLLLSRHANQNDLVFGTPIANRTRPEFENMIGLFVNTLALRFKLNEGLSFIDLLNQTKQTCLDAYSNQMIPFEYLVAELNPKRSLAYSPLLQVMLTLHNFPKTDFALPEINIMEEQRLSTIAKFDLTLILNENEGVLKGGLEYNSALFDALTIARLANHFQLLIENILANPNQSIFTYPMLAALELEQLIVEFNKPQLSYPKGVYIHELFEQQVKKSPQAIAVIFENQELTYEELNQAANQLAHHLQKLGVCPETLVGIYLERSLDMLISLLAVLKAGGAYVPIDPSYPTDRIRYVLQDSKVKILLTQTKLLSSLPSSKAIVVCVDDNQRKEEALASTNPVSRVSDENLAYIIYTSGSTGQPKGVMIQHNSFACVMTEWAKLHQLQPVDRFFQFSSISFDAAVGEIFATLIAGACLIMRSNRDSLVPSSLHQRFSELGITKCLLSTAYWHQFTAEIANLALPMPPLLKIVSIIGEAAQPNKVKIWQQHWGNTTLLVNLYGPTETAVIATEFKFFSDSILAEGPVPIGQPLNHVPIYILDSQGQPTPIGVPGEIHIGGVQVARGYLNQPQLTAEKFISDPFSKNEKGRLYKTGDLATWQADGNIQYLGRLDFQVKIRGFRVELGEIESCLATHPQVAEAVVIVHTGQADNSQLLAYLVCKVKNQLTAKEMRRHLAISLPEYMIPSVILFLESLPLNVNGKLDRKALPLPEDLESEHEKAYVPPQTPTEQTLAEIATKVLGVARVSMMDSFFELGGHSLLAIKLIEQCQNAFAQQISIRTLFEFPLFADFANQLAKNYEKHSEFSYLIPLSFLKHKPLLICVHGAEGTPFPFRKLAKILDNHFQTFAFQAPGSLNEHSPFRTIDEFSTHYLIEIEKLVSSQPFILLGYSGGGVIAQDLAVKMEKKGKGARALLLVDSLAPQALQLNSADSLILSMAQTLSRYFSNEEDRKVWLQELRKSIAKVRDDSSLIANFNLSDVLSTFEQLFHDQERGNYSTVNRLAKVYLISVLAISKFRPQYYAGEVILFKARATSLAAGIREDYGWSPFLSSSMTIVEIEANHESILEEGCELIGQVLKEPKWHDTLVNCQIETS